MAFDLSQLNITEVTLCKSPAVGDNAKFKLLKSLKEPVSSGNIRLTKMVKFQKSDTEKKQVFGYVLVPDVEDLQGDIVSAEEIEKACHSFMKSITHNEQTGDTGTGLEHQVFEGIGYPIENYFDSTGVNGIEGGWWLGTQITNETIWKAVQDGEITGYSLGGTGVRDSVDDSVEKTVPTSTSETENTQVNEQAEQAEQAEQTEDVTKTDAEEENKQSLLAKAFESLKKALTFEETKKEESKWLMVDSFYQWENVLSDTIWDIAYSSETNKKELIGNAFDACKKAIFNSIDQLTEEVFINKSIAEKENEGLTSEELSKAIQDSLAPIQKGLTALDDKVTGLQKAQEAQEAEDVAKAKEAEAEQAKEDVAKSAEEVALTAEDVAKAVKEALEPLAKSMEGLAARVETVENVSTGSTRITGQEQADVQKSVNDESFAPLLSGLLG